MLAVILVLCTLWCEFFKRLVIAIDKGAEAGDIVQVRQALHVVDLEVLPKLLLEIAAGRIALPWFHPTIQANFCNVVPFDVSKVPFLVRVARGAAGLANVLAVRTVVAMRRELRAA